MRIDGKFRDDGSILLRSIEAMVRQRVAITSDLLRHKVGAENLSSTFFVVCVQPPR